jgi:outer membrane protein TolC
MRKYFAVQGVVLGALLPAVIAFGQGTSPTATPSPTPTPTIEPTPAPQASPKGARDVIPKGFEWSEVGAPTFRLDQAVLTALQRNPDILRAKEELQRTKGVVLEISAQALPQITPDATFRWTDPKLGSGSFSSDTVGNGTGGGVVGGSNVKGTDIAYAIRITGTQLVFNYSTFRQIRGTFFQRDGAYFAFRNVLDQVIATVKTQFYQVILNRALITVQEESVRLLESQLKDQENRFEAGTVPRFNVLQAQVQLSNQIPNLIAARNNYRISILQLAKILGLDFNPLRGVAAPLHAVGELTYTPRPVSLVQAVELGKRNRPFLKQARANVFNAIEQVHVALGGFLPNFSSNGGYEIFSSPLNSSFHDTSKGWIFGLTGTWAVWDSGATYGRVKQQRALLSEAKITYDDDVRQVELEIQQAASNLLQNRELIQATEKNVEQADEAVRLAKARLDAGAGTQLDVLNAQVQLTTAQSTRLQALFGYDSSLAEFDRVTGAQSVYTEGFNNIAPRAARSKRYYTGSDVDATGKPRRSSALEIGPVSPMSPEPSSK